MQSILQDPNSFGAVWEKSLSKVEALKNPEHDISKTIKAIKGNKKESESETPRDVPEMKVFLKKYGSFKGAAHVTRCRVNRFTKNGLIDGGGMGGPQLYKVELEYDLETEDDAEFPGVILMKVEADNNGPLNASWKRKIASFFFSRTTAQMLKKGSKEALKNSVFSDEMFFAHFTQSMIGPEPQFYKGELAAPLQELGPGSLGGCQFVTNCGLFRRGDVAPGGAGGLKSMVSGWKKWGSRIGGSISLMHLMKGEWRSPDGVACLDAGSNMSNGNVSMGVAIAITRTLAKYHTLGFGKQESPQFGFGPSASLNIVALHPSLGPATVLFPVAHNAFFDNPADTWQVITIFSTIHFFVQSHFTPKGSKGECNFALGAPYKNCDYITRCISQRYAPAYPLLIL